MRIKELKFRKTKEWMEITQLDVNKSVYLQGLYSFFFFFLPVFYLKNFIYFWLHWVFTAALLGFL